MIFNLHNWLVVYKWYAGRKYSSKIAGCCCFQIYIYKNNFFVLIGDINVLTFILKPLHIHASLAILAVLACIYH